MISNSNVSSEVQWLYVFIFCILLSNLVFLFYVIPHADLYPGHSRIFFNMVAWTAPVQILLLASIQFRFLDLRYVKWIQYTVIYTAGTYGYINVGGAIGPFNGFYVTFLALTIVFMSTKVTTVIGIISFVPLLLTLVLEQLGFENPYLNEGQVYTEYVALAALFLFAAVLAVALATKNITAAKDRNFLLTQKVRSKNRELGIEKSEVEERILVRTAELAKANQELRKQTIELLEAKNKAEEADRTKSNFLANMSHEIRTPLTSIIGTADLLMEDAKGENVELVEMIYNGGNRLMNTLNSVLDLAQLEGQSMKLNQQAIDVFVEVQAVFELFINRAAKKNLNLEVLAEDAGPFVAHLDKAAFDRVLQNLIGNAMKFTVEGSVKIILKRKEDYIFVTIEDTGIGISEEYLPRIFDQFSQESSGESRAFEGNGLGLALSKGLVEMMDGSISVESKLGVGTAFTLQFPASMEEPGDKTPATEDYQSKKIHSTLQ